MVDRAPRPNVGRCRVARAGQTGNWQSYNRCTEFRGLQPIVLYDGYHTSTSPFSGPLRGRQNTASYIESSTAGELTSRGVHPPVGTRAGMSRKGGDGERRRARAERGRSFTPAGCANGAMSGRLRYNGAVPTPGRWGPTGGAAQRGRRNCPDYSQCAEFRGSPRIRE